MVVSTNGGSSYLATGYLGGETYISISGGGITWSDVAATTYYFLGGGIPSNCYIFLENMTSGGSPAFNNMTGAVAFNISQQTTGSINAIQFQANSGTFTAGTFTLYGILE
jgi:hypothetical protein